MLERSIGGAPAWRGAAVLCAVAAGQALGGGTLRVPGEFATIGDAIAAALPGDTVLVADGVYSGPGNRGLDFQGKAITVRSENGPEHCVIDCEGLDRGFFFQSEEGRDSVVEGFTVTHGNAANGGGIECTLISSPTIRDCWFIDNFAMVCGGGIAARGQSMPRIERCRFEYNTTRSDEYDATGGGLCFFILGDATVVDCVFIGNEAEFGGAMAAGVSYPTIINCLVIDNFAEISGGGIVCSSADPRIYNTTFVGNSALRGGAVDLSGVVLDSFPELVNCIAWGNYPEEFGGIRGEVFASYSDIRGGWPGTGNIDTNPRFIDDDAGDYRLGPDSPCVDAGSSPAVPNGIETDLLGNARFADIPDVPDTGLPDGIHDGVVDMGPYESQPDCAPDFNGDGAVNTQDVIAFLNAWAAGDSSADFNGDGSVNTQDVLAFLNAWAAGC